MIKGKIESEKDYYPMCNDLGYKGELFKEAYMQEHLEKEIKKGNIITMILLSALFIIAMIFLNSCASIQLENRPVIKKLKIQGELVCIYEVKFVTGEDRCIPLEEYVTEIEPYEIVLPYETYEYFKALSLKACRLGNSNYVERCSHDVKSVDDWVQALIKIQRKYSK